jgi:hypothetical protein
MELRAYQQDAVDSVFQSWLNFDRVLGVAPTGSGKTIIFAEGAARGLASDVSSYLARVQRKLTEFVEAVVGTKGLKVHGLLGPNKDVKISINCAHLPAGSISNEQ